MKVPTLGHRVTGYAELQGSAAGDSMISVYLSSLIVARASPRVAPVLRTRRG
jgi:hypothetical protein